VHCGSLAECFVQQKLGLPPCSPRCIVSTLCTPLPVKLWETYHHRPKDATGTRSNQSVRSTLYCIAHGIYIQVKKSRVVQTG
jgi:hypothetical protein